MEAKKSHNLGAIAFYCIFLLPQTLTRIMAWINHLIQCLVVISRVGLLRLKWSTVLSCLKLSGAGQGGVGEGKEQAILRNCLKTFRKALYGGFFGGLYQPTFSSMCWVELCSFLERDKGRQALVCLSVEGDGFAALLPTPLQGWRWCTPGLRATSSAVTAQLWPRYLPVLSPLPQRHH